ncbi:vicilin Cor a 11.0101-like [Malania oleifera]|uniref:vicilin Cor a 11.0101-like n=1 Tax=Malania oleifera TaxID=397392 RepID=UPI0025AE1865|nr:vicilin Cor a 11.0101-like [Malania oleifera]
MALDGRLALLIIFSLFLLQFGTFAATRVIDPELQQCKHQCRHQEQYDQRQTQVCVERCEAHYRQKHGGDEPEEKRQHNPYLLEEEQFTTRIESEEGRIHVLQNFAEWSELLRGVEEYRVAILQANPRTFVLPVHLDAESIFYVAQGRATIKLVRRNQLESVSVQHGDIIRINAGVPVYIINNEENEDLWIVKLFRSVSVPGKVETFVDAGGENPETYYRAFSTELLEAALNSERRKWDGMFKRHKSGLVVKASREQLEEMSSRGRQQEEDGFLPFVMESKRKAFNLLKKDPSISNDYGRLHVADSHDYERLHDLDLAVSFASIKQGSMEGPYYNSRATKIAVVVEGEGYFEMASPRMSSWGSSGRQEGGAGKGCSARRAEKGGQKQEGAPTYQKISGWLRPGRVLVVPPGHPVAVVASESRPRSSNDGQNLQILCFDVNNHGNLRYPLAGKGNVVSWLEDAAKELAFDTSSREVDDAFGRQEDELFFRGPEQWREGRGGRGDA